MPHQVPGWSPLSRRAFLSRYAGGIGSLALSHLLADRVRGDASPVGWPSATETGQAKSVICLFQHGGPSQMDLFDPKPELTNPRCAPCRS